MYLSLTYLADCRELIFSIRFTGSGLSVPRWRYRKVVFNSSTHQIISPEYFYTQLEDFRSSLIRQTEAGNRVIIAHFVCHAINIARIQFNLPRLALASKVDVPGEAIPDIGFMSGTLDFATESIKGNGALHSALR